MQDNRLFSKHRPNRRLLVKSDTETELQERLSKYKDKHISDVLNNAKSMPAFALNGTLFLFRLPRPVLDASYPPCKLYVLLHNRNSLGVNRAQIRILEEMDHECFGRLLQCLNCLALPSELRPCDICADFSDDTCEGEFSKKEIGGFLVLPDFAQCEGTGFVAAVFALGHRVAGCGLVRRVLNSKQAWRANIRRTADLRATFDPIDARPGVAALPVLTRPPTVAPPRPGYVFPPLVGRAVFLRPVMVCGCGCAIGRL
jgi:hypothetical protein